MNGINQCVVWAQKSCSAWNGNGLSRVKNRKLYLRAAEDYSKTPEYRDLLRRHFAGEYWTDVYLYPFNHPDFADWEEDDNPEHYTLVPDRWGFVVKHSASYVAQMIYLRTGVEPLRKTKKRFDAKIWDEFLAEIGFTEIVDRPEPGYNYVGIKPDEGEFGLVVWFEKLDFGEDAVIVSTYLDKNFKNLRVPINEYTWVKVFSPKKG